MRFSLAHSRNTCSASTHACPEKLGDVIVVVAVAFAVVVGVGVVVFVEFLAHVFHARTTFCALCPLLALQGDRLRAPCDHPREGDRASRKQHPSPGEAGQVRCSRFVRRQKQAGGWGGRGGVPDAMHGRSRGGRGAGGGVDGDFSGRLAYGLEWSEVAFLCLC